jgi:hypothetical protein
MYRAAGMSVGPPVLVKALFILSNLKFYTYKSPNEPVFLGLFLRNFSPERADGYFPPS